MSDRVNRIKQKFREVGWKPRYKQIQESYKTIKMLVKMGRWQDIVDNHRMELRDCLAGYKNFDKWFIPKFRKVYKEGRIK